VTPSAATPQALPVSVPQVTLPSMQLPPPPPPPLLPPEGPVTWDDWCEVLRRQPPLAPAPNQALHLYTRMALRQPARPPAPLPDVAATAAHVQQQPAPAAGGCPATPSAAATRPQEVANPAQVPMPRPNGSRPQPSSLQRLPKAQQGAEPAAAIPASVAVSNGHPATKPDRLSGVAPMQLPPPDPQVPSAMLDSTPVKQEHVAAASLALTPLRNQEPAKTGGAGIPPPPPQQQTPVAPVHQQPASAVQQLPAAAVQQQPAGFGALAATTGRAAEGKRRTGGTPAAAGSIAYNLLAGGKRQSGAGASCLSSAHSSWPNVALQLRSLLIHRLCCG
jgi:hypothetical protein